MMDYQKLLSKYMEAIFELELETFLNDIFFPKEKFSAEELEELGRISDRITDD